MADKEIKGSMMKFNQSFDDFKAVHASYAKILDQEQRKEDEKNGTSPLLFSSSPACSCIFFAKITRTIFYFQLFFFILA